MTKAALKDKIHIRRKTKRIWELDFLRGLSIILMIVDHCMLNFMQLPQLLNNYYGGADWLVPLQALGKWYWGSDLRENLRGIFLIIFLSLTGISANLSRNNFFRCLEMFLASVILTIVTYIVDHILGTGSGYYFVIFGIIQMMTFSAIATALVKFFFKNDFYLYMFAAALLIATVALVHMQAAQIEWLPDSLGWIAKEDNIRWAKPNSIYAWLDVFYGFQVFGGDWFGIIPNTAVIMLGAAIGAQLYKRKRSVLPMLDRGNWHSGIGFVGRNTLWVYIFHQPLMYGSIFLLGYLAGAM